MSALLDTIEPIAETASGARPGRAAGAVTDAILVLNVGSSSIKFALYSRAEVAPPILRGKITGIGSAPALSARDGHGPPLPHGELPELDPAAGHDALIPALLDWLKQHQGGTEIVAAGHRVVHGGRDLAGPALITLPLLAQLDALVKLAPLHQPHNLAAIRSVAPGRPPCRRWPASTPASTARRTTWPSSSRCPAR